MISRLEFLKEVVERKFLKQWAAIAMGTKLLAYYELAKAKDRIFSQK
jgi:hypothetical protein